MLAGMEERSSDIYKLTLRTIKGRHDMEKGRDAGIQIWQNNECLLILSKPGDTCVRCAFWSQGRGEKKSREEVLKENRRNLIRLTNIAQRFGEMGPSGLSRQRAGFLRKQRKECFLPPDGE